MEREEKPLTEYEEIMKISMDNTPCNIYIVSCLAYSSPLKEHPSINNFIFTMKSRRNALNLSFTQSMPYISKANCRLNYTLVMN
jgi:hypothetical protein